VREPKSNIKSHTIEYVEKSAVDGVSEIVNRLIIQAIGDDKNDE
jgi:hypothetical protein